MLTETEDETYGHASELEIEQTADNQRSPSVPLATGRSSIDADSDDDFADILSDDDEYNVGESSTTAASVDSNLRRKPVDATDIHGGSAFSWHGSMGGSFDGSMDLDGDYFE